MPSLVLFGRRTLVAGDDLYIYSAISFIIRGTQILIAGFLLAVVGSVIDDYRQKPPNPGEAKCLSYQEEHDWKVLVYTYLTMSMVLGVAGLVIEALVWKFSGRGTPTQPEQRTPLKPICHANFTLLILVKAIILVCGIYVIKITRKYCRCNVDTNDCRRTGFELYLGLVGMHMVDVGFNAVVILYFGCKNLPSCPRAVGSETKWAVFCRFCCTLSSCLTCCLLGGRETITGDFTDVAVLLSDFFDFHGTLDLVPSDVVAGLLMVKRVQQEYVDECRQLLVERVDEIRNVTICIEDPELGSTAFDIAAEMVIANNESTAGSGVTFRLKRHLGSHYQWEPSFSELLVADKLEDQIVIAEGARFMRLSLAIYTWIMYSINRPYTGFCEISYLSVKEVCKKNAKIFPGDNRLCRLHAAAFMKESGLEESEIAYAQFRCAVKGHTPYAIVVDHDWKSVVIVIRGTGSLEDALTDLTLRPTSLEEVGKECGFEGTDLYAHAGMLTSTKWIYEDIQRNGVLDNLLLDEESKLSGYRLRITGHSLGAGCAAILSLMLRPKFGNLRAHCFCPPGCTMSENAAIECEEFLTSYVNNDDIIPRSSISSLENLRYDVVDMIARIKVPKNDVVCCYKRKYGDEEAKIANAQVLYSELETPESEFREQWQKFHELYQDRKKQRNFPDIELFPPGKLVHVVKTSVATPKSCMQGLCRRTGLPAPNEEEYVSRWATRLDFREIRLSGTCLPDHDGGPLLERFELEMRRLNAQAQYIDEYSALLPQWNEESDEGVDCVSDGSTEDTDVARTYVVTDRENPVSS
jgi:Lipase (class 3)